MFVACSSTPQHSKHRHIARHNPGRELGQVGGYTSGVCVYRAFLRMRGRYARPIYVGVECRMWGRPCFRLVCGGVKTTATQTRRHKTPTATSLPPGEHKISYISVHVLSDLGDRISWLLQLRAPCNSIHTGHNTPSRSEGNARSKMHQVKEGTVKSCNWGTSHEDKSPMAWELELQHQNISQPAI